MGRVSAIPDEGDSQVVECYDCGAEYEGEEAWSLAAECCPNGVELTGYKCMDCDREHDESYQANECCAHTRQLHWQCDHCDSRFNDRYDADNCCEDDGESEEEYVAKVAPAPPPTPEEIMHTELAALPAAEEPWRWGST